MKRKYRVDPTMEEVLRKEEIEDPPHKEVVRGIHRGRVDLIFGSYSTDGKSTRDSRVPVLETGQVTT